MKPSYPHHTDSTVQRLPMAKIKPAPERHYFGRDNLHPLAERMLAFGLIEPIVVRRIHGSYEIVSGKRRWLAAQLLGWRSIDAKIQDPS